MAAIKLFVICSRCEGTGTDLGFPALGGSYPNSGPCESCNATGFIEWGHTDNLEDRLKDLEDKVDAVLDKCNDILKQLTE